ALWDDKEKEDGWSRERNLEREHPGSRGQEFDVKILNASAERQRIFSKVDELLSKASARMEAERGSREEIEKLIAKVEDAQAKLDDLIAARTFTNAEWRAAVEKLRRRMARLKWMVGNQVVDKK